MILQSMSLFYMTFTTFFVWVKTALALFEIFPHLFHYNNFRGLWRIDRANIGFALATI
jgi:hypothetical protein